MEPEPTQRAERRRARRSRAPRRRHAPGRPPRGGRGARGRVAAAVEHRRAPGHRPGGAARHGRHRRAGAAARACRAAPRRGPRGSRRRAGESRSAGRSRPPRPSAAGPDPRAAERILGRPERRRRRGAGGKAADPARAGGVPGAPALLRAEVDDVPFPNYAAKFGWKPVGAREDDPSGRDATTVHYQKGARTIQYTIVSGDALDPPSDARSTTRARRRVPHLPRRRPNGRHLGARRPHVRALRQGGAPRRAPGARRLARQGRDPLLVTGRRRRRRRRRRAGPCSARSASRRHVPRRSSGHRRDVRRRSRTRGWPGRR